MIQCVCASLSTNLNIYSLNNTMLTEIKDKVPSNTPYTQLWVNTMNKSELFKSGYGVLKYTYPDRTIYGFYPFNERFATCYITITNKLPFVDTRPKNAFNFRLYSYLWDNLDEIAKDNIHVLGAIGDEIMTLGSRPL